MIFICCQKMVVFLDVHRYKSIEKMAYKKKLKDSYVASAVPQGTAQLQFAMGNIFMNILQDPSNAASAHFSPRYVHQVNDFILLWQKYELIISTGTKKVLIMPVLMRKPFNKRFRGRGELSVDGKEG